MLSDILIIDEPFIWVASINKSTTVVELSKVTNQQYFLLSNNSEALVEYYQKINENEVRRIDQIAKTSPFSMLDNMNLILINLN